MMLIQLNRFQNEVLLTKMMQLSEANIKLIGYAANDN